MNELDVILNTLLFFLAIECFVCAAVWIGLEVHDLFLARRDYPDEPAQVLDFAVDDPSAFMSWALAREAPEPMLKAA